MRLPCVTVLHSGRLAAAVIVCRLWQAYQLADGGSADQGKPGLAAGRCGAAVAGPLLAGMS